MTLLESSILATFIVAGVILISHLPIWNMAANDHEDTTYFRAFWKIILFGKIK